MSNKPLILSGKICPYCGKPTELIDSAEVYHGVSYGWMYICRPCDAYVGCYYGTTKSLGRLANAELRRYKHEAHEVFDQIWKARFMDRYNAYTWLSKKLGIERQLTHIGMFDVDTCKKVIQVSKAFLNNQESQNNSVEMLTIKLINNHIVIDDGQNLILDTGSPYSFHSSGKIHICGKSISVPTSLTSVSSEYLRNNVYDKAEGLLGMDVINEYPFTLSIKDDFVIIGDDVKSYQTLPKLNISPFVGLQLLINGHHANMIVDSGAKLSYIDSRFTIGLHSIGHEKDFSPYIGEFIIELFNCETVLPNLYIGKISYVQKYGTPPPMLSAMLCQLHVDGILGVDFFKQFRLHLRECQLFFPPQGI